MSTINIVEALPILRHERYSMQVLQDFLDARSRLLALYIVELQHNIHVVSNLLDPIILDGTSYKPLTSRQVASANKVWLVRVRSNLLTAIPKILVSFETIMSALFDSDPAIEDATDFSSNLGKIFRLLLDNLENMNKSLSEVESSYFPDDVMLHIGELRKTWSDLKLLVIDQISAPLIAELREEARVSVLKKLGELIHG